MKILLADDTVQARQPMEIMLTRYGHEVITADNGMDALTLYQEHKPDLLITDVVMPKMTGLDLSAQVKEINDDQDIIIITGYGDIDLAIQALRLGASNYLLKPVDLRDLNLAVTRVQKKLEITQRLEQQEISLARARKMADMGLIAAGLAHEINNPNTFIRGNLQTLKRFWQKIGPAINKVLEQDNYMDQNSKYLLGEIPDILNEMMAGTDRINKITQSLSKLVASAKDAAKDSLDVNHCLMTTVESMEPDLIDIGLRLDLEPNLPKTLGGKDDLCMAFMEIIKNAIESVAETQNPAISISSATHSAREITVSIKDNGCGIPDDLKENVLTPFFSTNSKIGRPGLGLSKAYAIVSHLGGELFFVSQQGQGSNFTIKLNSVS